MSSQVAPATPENPLKLNGLTLILRGDRSKIGRPTTRIRLVGLPLLLGRPERGHRQQERDMESVPAVIEALERAPRIVVPLVREMPATLLKRRPKSGKWSGHEHACHLAVVHGLFFQRLEQILATPAPVITPYDPGTQDADDALLQLDLDESLDAFARDRGRLVKRLRELSPSDWQRAAEHGEYSHYSVFIMFRHVALHDFFHAYRIEELLLNRDWATEFRGARDTG